MLKSRQSKCLGLMSMVASMSLLMGACPEDILNPNVGDPSTERAAAPTLVFVQPSARVNVEEGTPIGIQWSSTHPAGALSVQLFFDRDGVWNTGDETTIVFITEAAASTGGTYSWNTTGIAANVYRLGARINDQENPESTVYFPYEIVIRSTGGTPTGLVMSLEMLTPAVTTAPNSGDSLMISWKATVPSGTATLYLYYDADQNPANDNKVLIAVVNSGTGQIGSSDFGWTIPQGLTGDYYILGRLHSGAGTDVWEYAPGRVQANGGSVLTAERDLSRIGSSFAGFTFNGSVPYGRLGEVMTGGRDANGQVWDYDGDGYSDFILVAPKLLSSLYANVRQPDGVTGVGEAYLIYSRGVAGRWPQGQSVSVGGITTYALEGVKFVGPRFTTSSTGIQEVMFLDDVDGDTRPEILLSTSDINGVVEDQQDYDPLDDDAMHTDAPPGWSAGEYYWQFPGWQQRGTEPDDAPYDWLIPNQMRSGLVVWLTSQCEGTIRNRTVMIDEIGGVVPEPLGPSIALGRGMKVFPIAGGDDSGWGARVGSSYFFGTRDLPTVFVARPNHEGGAGSVKVMQHALMTQVVGQWMEDAPSGLNDISVDPNSFTFPVADSDEAEDEEDRRPEWPRAWNVFMDPMNREDIQTSIRNMPHPSATHFDIINTNVLDSANGHMTNPTGLRDFDGDRTEDVAVAMPGSLQETGLAYVIYGQSGFIGVDLANFASVSGAVQGFELRGTQVGERLGHKMVGPGNVTTLATVQLSDWVLTAPKRDWSGRANCGAVVLIPGQYNRLGSYTLDEVITTLGGAIIYGSAAGDELGTYLAAAGDVDRDGYKDFLVSAPGYSDVATGRNKCGAVYLIYGGPHLLGGEFDVGDIGTATLPGKVYIGPEANAMIGPVSSAGDTDRDFYEDFLIAQPNANALNLTQSGRVWLIYGGRRTAP